MIILWAFWTIIVIQTAHRQYLQDQQQNIEIQQYRRPRIGDIKEKN